MLNRYHFFDKYRLDTFIKYCRKLNIDNDILCNVSILDVGGGEGIEASLILMHRPRFFILMDSDPTIFKYTRMNLEQFNNNNLLCADGERIPLKDKSIDVVIFRDVLHHLVNPIEGVMEGIRVARRAILIDEPAHTRMRDLFNKVFVNLGIKKEYEIRNNRRLKFRISKEALNKPALDNNFKVFYFTYLFYSFGWSARIKNSLIKLLLKHLFIILNLVLPIKNRAFIIMVPGA